LKEEGDKKTNTMSIGRGSPPDKGFSVSVSVVRESRDRLVDNRSTTTPLLVPKPGGNTKVWSLVEAQTLRFGGGWYVRRL
jgi:hypothetical protein